MHRFTRAALSFALLTTSGMLVATAPVLAQDTTRKGVTIGLTYDPGTKPGIAVLPVPGAQGDSERAIIQRDLDYSDLFSVIVLDGTDPAAFRGSGPAAGLNYPLFAKMAAQGVVQLIPTATGLHVALHDVTRSGVANVGEFPLFGQPLSRQWRLSVHAASDQIVQWITGQRGIAATRIAYSPANGGGVHLVDSDGADDVVIPTLPNAVSPAWNASANMLTYATWGVGSRIVTYDLRSGATHTLKATPVNTNLTPVFTPDGGSILYSHAGENGSDLYQVSLTTGEVRRISAGRGTDNMSPSFSPDGMRVAFTSGRAGHPEIYIMDADGSNPDLLTSFDFGDQNYRSDPDWSPDGRQVAFQARLSGAFQVMTINLRDRSTKQLTSEGENQQPAWAPDGRHLVFTSTRSGSKQLWVMDTESGRMRQLTHGNGARLPAWSPRMTAQ